MASEITLTASLSVTIGGSTVSSNSSKVLDLSGNECLTKIDSVGYAADQAVDLSSLDTLGYLLVQNLDDTNYIQVSTGTGGGFTAAVICKVRPGCVALLEPPTATLYVKAASAACNVRFTAVEV